LFQILEAVKASLGDIPSEGEVTTEKSGD